MIISNSQLYDTHIICAAHTSAENKTCFISNENIGSELTIDIEFHRGAFPKKKKYYCLKLDKIDDLTVFELCKIMDDSSGEKMKDIIHEIKSLRSKIRKIEVKDKGERYITIGTKYLNNIVFEEDSYTNVDEAFEKDEEQEYEVILGHFSVPLDTIQSESFNFREYVSYIPDYDSVPSPRCSLCGSTDGSFCVTPKIDITLCTECVDELAITCAEIGGHDKIKNKIIADTI